MLELLSYHRKTVTARCLEEGDTTNQIVGQMMVIPTKHRQSTTTNILMNVFQMFQILINAVKEWQYKGIEEVTVTLVTLAYGKKIGKGNIEQ